MLLQRRPISLVRRVVVSNLTFDRVVLELGLGWICERMRENIYEGDSD